MNKKVLLIGIIFITVIILGFGVAKNLLSDGYAYYGNGWQDTPEMALKIERDSCNPNWRDSLTIYQLIDIQYVDDIAMMTFVSEIDTLVVATFVTNETGQYHFYGFSEEKFLDSPTSFVVNGISEQWVSSPYERTGSTVYGWKYSTAPTITVNGIFPRIKTYIFDCQGKEWSIDYWWIDNFQQDSVTIEYISE